MRRGLHRHAKHLAICAFDCGHDALPTTDLVACSNTRGHNRDHVGAERVRPKERIGGDQERGSVIVSPHQHRRSIPPAAGLSVTLASGKIDRHSRVSASGGADRFLAGQRKWLAIGGTVLADRAVALRRTA
jgi:hypothetical protein